MADSRDLVLDVAELRTEFATPHGRVAVVDGLSLEVPRGKTVALVGESGCGKSVTALSLMRLVRSPPGRVSAQRVEFAPRPGSPGIDLLSLSEREMCAVRGGRIALVFQEPASAFNPVQTIGGQIVESVRLHRRMSGGPARRLAEDLLHSVGIAEPHRCADQYPHQLSGGMQQRALLATALAGGPCLLIADEPTTALDVTTQAQIIELLARMQAESGLSVLFIAHDLAVVAGLADTVYVMYAGQIVERGPTAAVLSRPAHPYTQALLECAVQLDGSRDRLSAIPGETPLPGAYPHGCRFHPRCALSEERARTTAQPTVDVFRGELSVSVLGTCRDGEVGDLRPEAPAMHEVGGDHFAACRELGDG
ncbi:MAG: ABC transporter ATP-binding protein [bacterium]|nr:ABC transporter ATP-binding protein [bacterium]